MSAGRSSPSSFASPTERLSQRLPALDASGGWRTRFAPAPTGYLHLGHLVNALCVWGIARAYGGEVLLRIEDHDRTRCRPEYERALLEDLDWLGFHPDLMSTDSYRAQRTGHPGRQSDNDAVYVDALAALEARGLVYACDCTRRMIAGDTPRAAGEERAYPGTCRERGVDRMATPARRVRLDAAMESFDDLRLGPLSQTPAEQCGDLLARDRNGNWTYQFAVTMDDMRHGVDVIIRGEDLLASTGRQRQLSRLLGRERMPLVLHHPLLVHADGSKLSKANHDTALRERRALGATPAQLLGEAAHRAGLAASPAPLDADDVAMLFRVS